MQAITTMRGLDISPAIRKTLVSTFICTGAMLGVTAVTSLIAISLGITLSTMASILLMVVSLGLMFAVYKTKNSSLGLLFLGLFAVSFGVSLGPILNHYLSMSNGTFVVATAAGLTSLAVLGTGVTTIVYKKDFSHLRSFLFAGTLILLGAILIGFFIQVPAFHLTVSAVASLLFVGWLLYDIGDVVHGRETNYIIASMRIYIDIINLFMHLLRLVGAVSGND